MIKLKRVYEEEAPDDGVRYLIERLWPRGIKKESLHIDAWLKDAGPSTELRKWFSHDPKKWNEFRRRNHDGFLGSGSDGSYLWGRSFNTW